MSSLSARASNNAENVVQELRQKYSFDLLISWAVGKLVENQITRKNKTSGKQVDIYDFSLGGRRFDQYGDVKYDNNTTGNSSIHTIYDTLVYPLMSRLRELIPLLDTTENPSPTYRRSTESHGFEKEYITIDTLVNPNRIPDIPMGVSYSICMPIKCLDNRDVRILNRYTRRLNKLLIDNKIPLSMQVIDNFIRDNRSIETTKVVLPGSVRIRCRSSKDTFDETKLPVQLAPLKQIETGHLETYLIKLYAYIPIVRKVIRNLTRFNLERIHMEKDLD